MAHHNLKTDPIAFQDIWDDLKNFEVRFNDRDYKLGDTLTLIETRFSSLEMKAGRPLILTGRQLNKEIDYVFHGGNYGIKSGWVILSIS